MKVDNKIINPKWERQSPNELDYTELPLTNEDFFFKETRGMSLGAIGVVIREKLNEIKDIMEQKDNP